MRKIRCINCMGEIEENMDFCPHCGYGQREEQSPFGIKPNTILRGRYLIGRVLGQGGFGITYIGYDLTLDIKVAVKEYFPMGLAVRNSTVSNQIQWNTTQINRTQWEQGCDSFLMEARKMARIDSLPGIVRARDTFPENGTAYIVMDYIEGENLKQVLLKNGKMSMEQCIKMLRPLMESLEKMHQKGLIHRDISPDNIMVCPDGSAWLLDFGTAKDISFQQSISSQQVAKKGFSPPEQYQEKGKIGPWTDVYALCATIYYCVAGQRVPDALDRIYKDTLDFDGPIQESLGKKAADALRDGLKLRGEERIQTVEKLLRQLSDPIPPKPPQPMQKKHILLSAAVAACALLLIFMWINHGNKEPDTVEEEVEELPNTLMEDSDGSWVNDDLYQGTVLGSEIRRDSIVAVTFTDTLDAMPDTAWDVSWSQDGTVMAWTEQDGDSEGSYHLFIGADGGVKGKSCYRLFTGYHNVEKIEFNNSFDTTEVISMKSMFYGCRNLAELDVGNFKTDQVTDMSFMFRECSSLETIDVSGFNTKAVTSMKSMFCGCGNLVELDVSNFETDQVIDMSFMFQECSSLETIDVSGFETGQVTTMRAFFEGCGNLAELDVGNFKTDRVTDMGWMFNGCGNLAELDVSGFNTANVVGMGSMFKGCESLKKLDVSNFNTGKVADMSYMFKECSSLETIDVSGFETGQVTTMCSFFEGCGNLAELDVGNFKTDRVTDMGWMFYGCGNLAELDVSGFNTKAVTRMKSMFNGCGNLAELDVSNFETDQVTDMSYMFNGCKNLEGLDASSFYIGPETDVKDIFTGCSFTSKDANLKIHPNMLMEDSAVKETGGEFQGTVFGSEIRRDSIVTVTFVDTLDEIPDTAWDVSMDKDGTVMAWVWPYDGEDESYDLFIGADGCIKGTDCSWMFAGYYNADDINFNNCLDTSGVTSMYCMFYDCINLTGLNVSNFNTANVTNMAWMFGECSSLPELDVSGFKTGNVTNMDSMFKNCQNLTGLDVSGFDTANVTNMRYVFYNCGNLTELDVSNFATSNVTDMEEMFGGCESLTNLDVSNFDTSKAITENMFDGCGITAEEAKLKTN